MLRKNLFLLISLLILLSCGKEEVILSLQSKSRQENQIVMGENSSNVQASNQDGNIEANPSTGNSEITDIEEDTSGEINIEIKTEAISSGGKNFEIPEFDFDYPDVDDLVIDFNVVLSFNIEILILSSDKSETLYRKKERDLRNYNNRIQSGSYFVQAKAFNENNDLIGQTEDTEISVRKDETINVSLTLKINDGNINRYEIEAGSVDVGINIENAPNITLAKNEVTTSIDDEYFNIIFETGVIRIDDEEDGDLCNVIERYQLLDSVEVANADKSEKTWLIPDFYSFFSRAWIQKDYILASIENKEDEACSLRIRIHIDSYNRYSGDPNYRYFIITFSADDSDGLSGVAELTLPII